MRELQIRRSGTNQIICKTAPPPDARNCHRHEKRMASACDGRAKAQRRVMSSVEPLASMTRYDGEHLVNVCLVGGSRYLDVMLRLVELFRKDGFVTGSAPAMVICGSFGIMRTQAAHS